MSKTPEQIYNDLWYSKKITLENTSEEISQEWLDDIYKISYQWDLPNKIKVQIDWYTIDVVQKMIHHRYTHMQNMFGELKSAIEEYWAMYNEINKILFEVMSDKINNNYKYIIDKRREDIKKKRELSTKKMWWKMQKEADTDVEAEVVE